MKGKHLVTTDNWFYAPDGLKYRAVWGEVVVLDDDTTLGIKTNKGSSNWYVFVGNQERGMLVAGCQLHYAVKCSNPPNTQKVEDYTYDNSGATSFVRPSEIYLAE